MANSKKRNEETKYDLKLSSLEKEINRRDESLQIEIMKWNVERIEVANITLIQRATSLIGFCLVELGLIANLASHDSPSVKEQKWWLFSSVSLTVISIASFIVSLDIRNLGTPYQNKHFAGKSGSEIIHMLHKTSECLESEESLQEIESTYRASRVRFGLWILFVSFIPLLWALLKILTSVKP